MKHDIEVSIELLYVLGAQKSKWIWTPSMVLKRWLPISLIVCVLKGLGFSQLWKGKRIPRELGCFEWEAYDLFQQGACLCDTWAHSFPRGC